MGETKAPVVGRLGGAAVEFGVLAAAAGTVALVASTLMEAPDDPAGATALASADAGAARSVLLSGIESTSFGAAASHDGAGSYADFRSMMGTMDGADLAKLHAGLPASFEVRMSEGDLAGAAEVLAALRALDDAIGARGMDATALPERAATDVFAERLRAARR